MAHVNWPFRSGTSHVKGCRVDRVLRASTVHMPDLFQDLSNWHWGEEPSLGVQWFWAYEEADLDSEGNPIPPWLLDLCIKARDEYGCNWVMLDPDGSVIPGLPVYEHP